MRVLMLYGIAVILLSAGCASQPRTSIATADRFREVIVDRTLAGGEGWNELVIQSDGTMAGLRADGAILSGTWAFDDGFFCREAIVNGASLSSDCQIVRINGDSVVFVRNRGRGEPIAYFFR